MLWLLVVLLVAPAVWSAARRPLAVLAGGGLLLMAAEENDSDIKIAGREAKTPPEVEALREAAQLAHYKQTGDVEKARALGGQLARMVMAAEIAAYCGGSAAGRIHLHCRLLLSCAVQDALKSCLPANVLTDVANTAFNETLEGEYPNFYKQMTNSGALSFYTLGLRGEGDPADGLGRTFARLTDREGDDAAAKDGAHLYRDFLATVDQTVEACGLKR
ncbi:hypothetical protein [Ethanoligenens sp.]|uniref:hypothetical protein n=1 Tax=Ethanoligenens sp. TaxID=2099655 RepID=UPI0039E81A82